MRETTSGKVELSWKEQGNDRWNKQVLSQCDVSTWHRLVGVYNQDFEPPKGLSVREILDLADKRNVDGPLLSEREVMDLTAVSDFVNPDNNELDTVVGAGFPNGREYSGGQMKQIALCLALRALPAILVLDEPTAHVSPETSRIILAKICAVARQRGQTVIIVSHNESNFEFVDRTLTISEGKVVKDTLESD